MGGTSSLNGVAYALKSCKMNSAENHSLLERVAVMLERRIVVSIFGIVLLTIITPAKTVVSPSKDILKNHEYQVRLVGTDLEISHNDGDPRMFTSEFTIFFTTQDPQKRMRRADIGYNQTEKVLYNVPSWGREELAKIDPSEHVMDGFNPEIDRGLEQGRTANYYLAAFSKPVFATEARIAENSVEWIYPENEICRLSAKVTLPAGKGQPRLTFTMVPKQKGWYSAGYTGAPRVRPEAMDEMWLPMIWQEKRFPNLPYLIESFQCPLPTALVTWQGITVGVLADPSEMPFMPLPKSENSTFGVMVRDRQGQAQPSLFAPVLGGVHSRMEPGCPFRFTAQLVCSRLGLLETFEAIARSEYGFRDYRRNTTVTLNQTFENMMDYNMSPFSQFVDELRGCSYATDVPGAVKNITGLHPLSLAIITDDQEVYEKRARPMIEYGLSRERFLFATNPEINRDGTSARLEGPGVPMSDFAAVYAFSQGRMENYLRQAMEIYHKPIHRTLNLTEQLYGDRWQNAMCLYHVTGNKEYLQKAIDGADEYLRKRIETPQVDFNDRDSRGMFFWTSYAPQWMELYLLYEITGETRYLEAARTGGHRYAQFVWFCPMIPNEKVLVNIGNKAPRYRSGDQYEDLIVPEEWVEAWRVSEIGLTPESSGTCHGHRGIYLAQYAPWMLRIARDSGDLFLHDIARSAVVGRYESFPGYHMNAGRTTAHEKADFPLRSLKELNGVTSLHYNHPWPHAAMIMDYLVSDVYYCSDGLLDFPAEYAEGYAYCRSKVYGAKPGTFYDGRKMFLYMPKGLASSSNVQINYLAARGDGKLYLMLTNQSQEEQTAVITLNTDLLGIGIDKKYPVEVWIKNQRAADRELENGKISISVAPRGITALAIGSVNPVTVFQDNVLDSKSGKWKKDQEELDFGNGCKAVLFNFGPHLQSVYSYIKANEQVFKKVIFHYASDGQWASVVKDSYPFEFTVPVPPNATEFRFYYEAEKADNETVHSHEGVLRRQ